MKTIHLVAAAGVISSASFVVAGTNVSLKKAPEYACGQYGSVVIATVENAGGQASAELTFTISNETRTFQCTKTVSLPANETTIVHFNTGDRLSGSIRAFVKCGDSIVMASSVPWPNNLPDNPPPAIVTPSAVDTSSTSYIKSTPPSVARFLLENASAIQKDAERFWAKHGDRISSEAEEFWKKHKDKIYEGGIGLFFAVLAEQMLSGDSQGAGQ